MHSSESLEETRARAERGDAGAQLQMGRWLEPSFAVAPAEDPAGVEAVAWYRKAAEQGSLPAQKALASCYAHGRGVRQDLGEALRWSLSVAEREAGEFFQAAILCFAGPGGPPDPRRGVDYLHLAAPLLLNARALLGDCALWGRGVERDPAEAVRRYREAGNFDEARVNLGVCCLRGDGVDRDPQRAVGLFASCGHATAKYDLALCLAQGLGVERNPRRALRTMLEAAARGHERARRRLGLCKAQVRFALRRWLDADREPWSPPAAWWNTEAIETDVLTERIAELAPRPSLQHRIRADLPTEFQVQALSGDPDAQFQLGLKLWRGEGTAVDPGAAVAWFAEAAAEGHPEAQYLLGLALAGGVGLEADPAAAERWFREAAEWGCHYAQARLGMGHAGETRWLERAAAHGHPGAQFRLARRREADGDVEEARAWRHAATLGVPGLEMAREEPAGANATGGAGLGEVRACETGVDPRRLDSLVRLHHARERAGWWLDGSPLADWLEALGGRGKSGRHTPTRALELLVGLGASAVPALLGALASDRWRLRWGAAMALAELGGDARTARPALARALEDTRARVRRAALSALGKLGPAALPSLRRIEACLLDPDDEVRVRTCALVAALGAREVVPYLIRLLDHRSPEVRTAAARALGVLGPGDASVAQALVDSLTIDHDRIVVGAALAALLRSAPERIEEGLAPIRALLAAPLREVRSGGAWLHEIAALGPAAAPVAPLVVGHLAGPHEGLAVYALHCMGSGARAALETCGSSRSDAVREAVRACTLAQVLEEADDATAPGSESDVRGRMGTGGLHPARLELAAVLGDAVALRLLGREVPVHPDALDPAAQRAWAGMLSRCDLEARARVAAAIARLVLPAWQRQAYDSEPDRTVHALEDWIWEPSERALARVVERREGIPNQWCAPGAFAAAWAIHHAARFAETGAPATWRALVDRAVETWTGGAGEPIRPWLAVGGAPPEETRLSPAEAFVLLRRTVRRWVVPWALGRRDPLKEGLARLFSRRPGWRPR